MPWHYTSSFFVDEYQMVWRNQLKICEAIKHQYIGRGRLTQNKMEKFFHTDAFFVNATPGFFTGQIV